MLEIEVEESNVVTERRQHSCADDAWCSLPTGIISTARWRSRFYFTHHHLIKSDPMQLLRTKKIY